MNICEMLKICLGMQQPQISNFLTENKDEAIRNVLRL